MNLYSRLNKILKWVGQNPNKTAQEIEAYVKRAGLDNPPIHTAQKLVSKLYTDGEIYESGCTYVVTKEAGEE